MTDAVNVGEESQGDERLGHRITILVGTDHHPFERLVAWADQRAVTNPEDQVFVQYGSTRPPTRAGGDSVMTPATMIELIESSDIVVTHGGPGTIMDVKKAGHRPIVLARNPAHGEHVDQHQMQFAGWCDQRNLIRLISGPDELAPWIDKLGSAGTREAPEASEETAAAVRRFGELVTSARSTAGGRPTSLDAPLVIAVLGADLAQRSAMAAEVTAARSAIWLGEVARLTEGGNSPMCDCGELVVRCATWNAVITEAFGSIVDYESTVKALPQPAWTGATRRHPGRERREALLAHSDAIGRIVTAGLRLAGASATVIEGTRAQVLGLSHDRHLDLRVLLLGGWREGDDRLLLRYRSVPTMSPSLAATPEDVWARLAPATPHRPTPMTRIDQHHPSRLPHPF